MAEIAVLIPVLGRPSNAQTVVNSVTRTTDRARVVFITSAGDREQINACRATGCEDQHVGWEPGYADYQRKINFGFKVTAEPFIFTGADDLTFHDGWADACLACIDGFDVCGTDDMANPRVRQGLHSTHSLIRRSYVEEVGASWDGPGSVLSEAYDHQWCETETVELAKHRGVWTFCKAARVQHHHPIFDRAVGMDATYEKGMAEGRADQKVYLERRKEWAA